jgi:hypothetical protein
MNEFFSSVIFGDVGRAQFACALHHVTRTGVKAQQAAPLQVELRSANRNFEPGIHSEKR